MKRTTVLFFFAVVMTWVTGWTSPCGSTELGGYTFGDDSSHLFLNPFFSDDSRDVDFFTGLYGYGDFAGYHVIQDHQYTSTISGISCNVIWEEGYFPDYSSGGLEMVHYNAYHYYARDIEDNIHILQYSFHPEEGQTLGWNHTDLPEGVTTLKYPADPQPGQEVFCGSVTGVGIRVGDIPGCVTIGFDSLPYAPSETITEYLAPGAGVLASSFNWNNGMNGFSVDALPPESAEEDKSEWEEWWDDHCFISACSPGRTGSGRNPGKGPGPVVPGFRESRNTLTFLTESLWNGIREPFAAKAD